MERYPSSLLEKAVGEISRLPGIGRKTALRLALHLLRQDTDTADSLAEAIIRLRHDVKYCKVCHNISDTDVCTMCSDHSRDTSVICVVENVQDVMAIENTQQFNGLYHVLGGIISPMDGIGPSDLNIDSLVERVGQGGVKEVILALSSTMEGDTTAFYIHKLLEHENIKVSALSRGISMGEGVEYADEQTLARSIALRQSFDEIYKH